MQHKSVWKFMSACFQIKSSVLWWEKKSFFSVCLIIQVLSRSVVSNSLWPHGLWPARLLCPWNFPGKNTGGGVSSFSREYSWPRDWTWVSCIVGRLFTVWATREAHSQRYMLFLKIFTFGWLEVSLQVRSCWKIQKQFYLPYFLNLSVMFLEKR